MPIIAPIPRDERRLMQKAIHKTRDKNHARRLTAILMLHRGDRVSDVAKTLCCARSSVIPPFLAEVISRIRLCVEYAASVCSHSTPYSDVRYYKTIATEWHNSAIHPVM